jgi:hypothetical protein
MQRRRFACKTRAKEDLTLDRGRDVHHWAPPARIRTGPIRASGSYLGCLTAKRMLGQG